MARYKLEKPHYLNDRYYSEGAVVEFGGQPSRHMVPLDGEAQQRKSTYDARRPRPNGNRPRTLAEARAVAQPGGSPADPTWAPETRPAFSVLTENVNAGQPKNPEPDFVRVAAGGPTASAATTDGEGNGTDAADADAAAKPTRAPAKARPGRKAAAKKADTEK
jgi:hypothetical protein